MNRETSILTIDTGYHLPELAASFAVLEAGLCAIIETGTAHSRDKILAALRERGYGPESVAFIIVTHVHLDHAGGAGSLMQACPNATLVVHPRGARHLIDPTRLEESSRIVYGDERFEALYGSILPVARQRVLEAEDGTTIPLGERTFTIYHTPGHATHHFVVHDDKSNGVFTGDAFGLAYPPLQGKQKPFIMPAATPVRFDGPAFIESVRRVRNLEPSRLYLTHYGEFVNPSDLGQALEEEASLYLQWLLAAFEDTSLVTESDIFHWLHERIWSHSMQHYENLGGHWTEKTRLLVKQDMELNARGLAATVMGDRKRDMK